MTNIEQKYAQLTAAQKDIFAGYGLRQVKHFVEISLPNIEPSLPENTQVQGVNAEGKVQAINLDTQQVYIWISDLQWQERQVKAMHIDLKEDILKITTIPNAPEWQGDGIQRSLSAAYDELKGV